MGHWLKNTTNLGYVEALRNRLASDDASVFIFLGAGLSYGVDRGRVLFEFDEHDDGLRFPSWPQLVKRMQADLVADPVIGAQKESLIQFFDNQAPLDCTQLF